MDNRKFGKLVKKSMRPPFNDLVQPNMSKEAKAIMEHAMQRSCDEQVKSLVDWEPDYNYEIGKCNKTPEEAESIMREGVKEFCDEQDKKIGEFDAKEVAKMITRDYGDVLKRLSKT